MLDLKSSKVNNGVSTAQDISQEYNKDDSVSKDDILSYNANQINLENEILVRNVLVLLNEEVSKLNSKLNNPIPQEVTKRPAFTSDQAVNENFWAVQAFFNYNQLYCGGQKNQKMEFDLKSFIDPMNYNLHGLENPRISNRKAHADYEQIQFDCRPFRGPKTPPSPINNEMNTGFWTSQRSNNKHPHPSIMTEAELNLIQRRSRLRHASLHSHMSKISQKKNHGINNHSYNRTRKVNYESSRFRFQNKKKFHENGYQLDRSMGLYRCLNLSRFKTSEKLLKSNYKSKHYKHESHCFDKNSPSKRSYFNQLMIREEYHSNFRRNITKNFNPNCYSQSKSSHQEYSRHQNEFHLKSVVQTCKYRTKSPSYSRKELNYFKQRRKTNVGYKKNRSISSGSDEQTGSKNFDMYINVESCARSRIYNRKSNLKTINVIEKQESRITEKLVRHRMNKINSRSENNIQMFKEEGEILSDSSNDYMTTKQSPTEVVCSFKRHGKSHLLKKLHSLNQQPIAHIRKRKTRVYKQGAPSTEQYK